MNGFLMKTALLSCAILTILCPARIEAFEVVYSSCRGGGWDLWVLDPVEGTGPKRITSSVEVEESGPRWFAQDRKIVFSDNSGRIGVLDVETGETSFPALPEGKYVHPAVWPGDEGRLVFTSLVAVPEDDSDICMARFDKESASSIAPLVAGRGMETFPAISPDGRRLAYVYWPEDKPRSRVYGTLAEIRVREVDTGEDRRVTNLEADSFAPAWSPDGRMIAFASNKYGSYDIWTVSAEGGDAINVTAHEARDSSPAWTPDGEHLVFVSTRTGIPQLWMIRLGTDEARQLTHDECGVRDPDCSCE